MIMTNKIRIFLIACTLLTAASSCKKDFLTKDPNNALALNGAIVSEADLNNALAGVYAGLRDVNLFGRTLPVIGDVRADNEYVSTSNSGRYTIFNNYKGLLSNNADALGLFTAAYQVITRANQVITNTSVAASANVDNYKGQAYALRGLMYFQLIRNFARPYSTTDPLGVPVITEFYGSNSSPANTFPRDSVAKAYRQIVSDLEKAYTLMPATRNPNSSGYMSKYAARALEAKVYLYMKDYSNAQNTALDVVNNGGYSLAPSTGLAAYWGDPTLSTNKVEVMFEVASDIANNLGTNQLGYIFDQKGYGDILATKSLYNLYNSTDVRKGLIIPGTRAGNSVLVINKFPNTNSTTDKDDFPVVRYADLLLVLSEAYYNLNDPANALKYMNIVATQRDPSFTGKTSSGTQILEDILTERRKELAFEGDRFYDFWRLNRSIINKTQEENPYTSVTIDPTSPFYVLPIPQSELDLNKKMVQNPGY